MPPLVSGVVAPNGGNLIAFHMNGMSPGNNMKPQYTVDIAGSAAAHSAAATQAAKDSIDIHPRIVFNGDLIAQLNWAQRQGFAFRGHTLVWHSQTPAAFFRSGYTAGGTRLTKARMILRMENYIREVLRLVHTSWPGLLTAMDVVNESVNDNGTFRTSGNEWYTTFGDATYVMKAFEFARQYALSYGETQMKLYYNDYNTSTAAKADGIVNLCGPIFQAGLLDGIGMQEHDNLTAPTAQAFIDSYDKFAPICAEMAVTELDVATGWGSNSPSPSVLKAQANQYAMLFKCFVERSQRSGRGKIVSVSKDGLNDQYTFQTNQSSSLWDSLNHCKPAFAAVVDVGIFYNGLDSLFAVADSLRETDYTPASWGTFAATWTAAQNAAARNYSPAISASDTLHSAYDALIGAFAGLERNPNGVPPPRQEPFPFFPLRGYGSRPTAPRSARMYAWEAPSSSVRQQEEVEGFDIGEYGMSAYPEFAVAADRLCEMPHSKIPPPLRARSTGEAAG